MGDFKNLNNEEAIAKLKKLAEDIKICMFCTDLTHVPFSTRPMGVQEVDEFGNIEHREIQIEQTHIQHFIDDED